MEIVKTGVLVVGSGIAGLQAAVEARRQGCPVVLTDKGPIGRSGCSVLAEQIAGVLLPPGGFAGDSAAVHAGDTLAAGRGLADPALVERLAADAGPALARLIEAGVPFERDPNGRFLLEPMNGHRFPRSFFCADRTGQFIVRALRRQAGRAGVMERPDTLIVTLLKRRGRVAGALGLDLAAGKPVLFQAPAVVLACGGAGQLYPVSTNPIQSTGDGFALALRAGAALRDMEFIQFYPAVLVHPPALRGLILGISQHGRWLDRRSEPFPSGHGPDEQATRDVLSRMVAEEIRSGRTSPHGGVVLDVTGLEPEIYSRFRNALELCRRHGLDLTRDKAEVAPAAHYFMGGVRIDAEGWTGLPGLYAAGECAGGIHGANRLGNNSLLDALVFGARAGAAAGSRLDEAIRLDETISLRWRPGDPGGPAAPPAVRARLQAIMERDVGLLRCREGLEKTLAGIEGLQEILESGAGPPAAPPTALPRFPGPLVDFLETGNLLLTARAVAAAALARRESRGAHYREDHPRQDDARWRSPITVRLGRRGLEIDGPSGVPSAGPSEAGSRQVRLTVYRFDPADGRGPWYQTYRLEAAPDSTVLELLEQIRLHHDPGLAFRRSCGFGRCGICTLRLNGRPVLACREIARETELRLEPVHPERALKDLVERI